MASISVLDQLKPTKKLLVMDLLKEAGFDVSNWQHFKGKSPAANPKYCYNWSFEQPGEFVAACLWYSQFKSHADVVSYSMNSRGRASRRTEPGSGVWNRRAAAFEQHMRLAYSQRLPIKVIVVEGKQRDPADLKPKASVVKARLLDTAPWAVTEYDFSTGRCLLVRGEKPAAPAVESSDLVLSWFEGKKKGAFVYHRSRESRARRTKIREAMRLNGGKLVCEVPNCGFDFGERYGPLGEGYAQVHHLDPLRKAPKEGREVSLKDLAVVCANCHVMIHMGGDSRPLKGLIAAAGV
jgi:5-methylcytosine-specific restriction enzyme A